MKKKMFVVLVLVLLFSLVLMVCGGLKDDVNFGDFKVLNVWVMGDEVKLLKEFV